MTKEKAKQNMRELSFSILTEVLEQDSYCNIAIHNTLLKYQYLDKQDRAFLSRLSEGVIERVIELDYVINQFSKVKTTKMKAPIRTILRMGVYQILYMDQVPDRAACNEAVKLAQKKGFVNLKGFVNGVLRNISRQKECILWPNKKTNAKEYLSVRYSCPIWIVELWLKEYTFEETEGILKAFLQDKETTIRCNLTKITTEELKQQLLKENITVKDGEYLPFALKISDYNYLKKIKAFQEGLFQVQDESSMMVAYIAGIQKNDKIIDICAAPGGKATHAAELLEGTGIVSARDVSEEKVSLIEENAKRLNLCNLKAEVRDALDYRESERETADIVFADLLCSGLGVIGKKADIKYKTKEADLESLAKLQKEILKVAEAYVKPGGILMYSTCTINELENKNNIQWFTKHFNFELEPFDSYLKEIEIEESETAQLGYLQFLPGIHHTDGFFIAKLRKKG